MPVTMSIKNVPDELADRLRLRARKNHRSVQGELIAILENTLAPKALSIDELYELTRASGLRTLSDSVRILREERDAR